jgi:hypothetical protein
LSPALREGPLRPRQKLARAWHTVVACRLDYLTDACSRKFDANPRYRRPAAGLAAGKLIVGEVQPQVPDAHVADLVA